MEAGRECNGFRFTKIRSAIALALGDPKEGSVTAFLRLCRGLDVMVHAKEV
jgi:hypothetical protein